ncbi:hypothetical protein POM88_031713 [Heracleum sosnowskyi]|uniref:Uncharacterized protein n=1 Tax=Heracleum sosnowskyi TaxID=360622 RepID=A0AAD8HXX3_9APIA|nr:hypothetical protein POM88_031712 [Heracleum sosnowskyi]KAK1375520.1 hypothetical protein POM88_031713 [Heracleum sosnowskyi]
MPTDFVVDDESDVDNSKDDESDDEVECITLVQSSNAWTAFRNELAQNLFNTWRAMSSHLETIANAMSSTQNREIEVVEQKKRLLSEIASLSGMTKAEAIRATCLFTSNPSQMDVFFPSHDDDWKKEVIFDLIHRNDP